MIFHDNQLVHGEPEMLLISISFSDLIYSKNRWNKTLNAVPRIFFEQRIFYKKCIGLGKTGFTNQISIISDTEIGCFFSPCKIITYDVKLWIMFITASKLTLSHPLDRLAVQDGRWILSVLNLLSVRHNRLVFMSSRRGRGQIFKEYKNRNRNGFTV